MTLIEQLAQQRTNAVLSTAVSVAIEKMAEEAAREILRDPGFRDELRALAQHSVGRALRALHRNGPTRRKRAAPRTKRARRG